MCHGRYLYSMADPEALQVCVAVQQAVHFIGMPGGVGAGGNSSGDRAQEQCPLSGVRGGGPGCALPCRVVRRRSSGGWSGGEAGRDDFLVSGWRRPSRRNDILDGHHILKRYATGR
jgi:hypothetical protein